jgi:hypothetical protein
MAKDKSEPETFAERLVQTAEHALLKCVATGDWMKIGYSDRIEVSSSVLSSVYNAIDMDSVRKKLSVRLEDKLVDCILNSLATEIATDVKKVMSNTETREECRHFVRSKIKEIGGGD